MSGPRDDESDLDHEGVHAYWENASSAPASASYMAHEHGLPGECIAHRFQLEQEVVGRWFAGLESSASVLDIGCGAGAWTELFARRYARVVGVDGSEGMLAAATRRTAGHANVTLVHGNALDVPLDGEFDAALVGGLLMYLGRADAVALLTRLADLVPAGPIVLRESGVRTGIEVRRGTYPVVYRSVQEYEALVAESGLRVVEVEKNRGYAHMEIAVALVTMLRRLPPLARRDAAIVGAPVWRALRATAPVSLDLAPRVLDSLGLGWPHLTNHFLLLGK